MEPTTESGRGLIQLSPRQQTAVATALTILAAVVILCAIAGLGWLISAFLRRFSLVFLPVAVGAVAALVFNPYYEWLRSRLRMPAALALVMVFVSILVPLVAFGWFFGALAVHQISDMITRFPEWWQDVASDVQERWPRVLQFFQDNPWGKRLRAAVEGQQGALVEGLQLFGGKAISWGGVLLRGVGALVAWAVVPVYFAFFLMANPRRYVSADKMLPFLKADTRRDVVYLVTEFVNIIVAFFRGQLIIAFLQGLLFAIGFSSVGLSYGFVLGLLLGFLNIIPYLGSIIGLGIGLPLAYFQDGGGLPLIGLVLVVFTVVQLIESYFLTPKIMGDRTGLHPLAIIIAIFFWGAALQGILGMILAIPLTAFLVVFWRLAQDKYIGELL